jgi:hypothetical protein
MLYMKILLDKVDGPIIFEVVYLIHPTMYQ